MDQRTPFSDFGPVEPPAPAKSRAIKRIASTVVLMAALLLAVGAGYRLGHADFPLPEWVPAPVLEALGLSHGAISGEATGPVIYYRDPAGKPAYSADPRKTADGRDYVAVRASEDVSFEDAPEDAGSGSAVADQGGGRKILYYRNPMGLPDTSPVPKKDSMGMDYIPVYEGEMEDGSTVTVSPGKLQRTGVRSEAVARTTRVRIELPNPDELLLPDMYAEVEFATGPDKPVIAVPDSALIDTGTRQIVIIDKGEGRFEPREVKVGRRGGGFVGIREGVSEGEQVVIAANFLIDAESNLKAALQGFAAALPPDEPQWSPASSDGRLAT